MGIGGTELNAVRVAERLDPSRFELSVACLRDDGPLLARYQDAGIRVDRFPITSLAGASALREGLRFRSFLRRERVDVVHAHDRYTNAFAIPWARLAGVRVTIASKRWGAIGRAHRIANRVAYSLARRVLANSSRVAESLVTDDGVTKRRVVAIPNFVDDDAFAAPSTEWIHRTRARLGVAPDTLVVGIVANLRMVKDHATLIRAFSELGDAHESAILVLVGSGDEEQTLRRLAAQCGVENRVIFAGTLPNSPNLHHLFDLSVLTSLSEGFPNSLVEAMAAGKAVVATDVGGVADAVEDGITGLLVPAANRRQLSNAIRRLLDDPALRESMGAQGRQRARDHFSASSVIPLIERLYEGDELQ
jgi:glycosyltransferase involved in cell wall biosynthesis